MVPEFAVFAGDNRLDYPVVGRGAVIWPAVDIAVAKRHAQHVTGAVPQDDSARKDSGKLFAPVNRAVRYAQRQREQQAQADT